MRWSVAILGWLVPGFAQALTLDWNCPHSAGASVPTRTRIELPLTQNNRAWRLAGYPEIQIDMSQLDQVISQARASGRDLSDCVRDLSASNWWMRQESAERFCERTRGRDRATQCNPSQILAEVRTHILTQSEKLKNASSPQIEPLGGADAGSVSQTLNAMRATCRFEPTGSAQNAVLTSNTFLARLPEAMAGADVDCRKRMAQSLAQNFRVYRPGGCATNPNTAECRRFEATAVASANRLREDLLKQFPELNLASVREATCTEDAGRMLRDLEAVLAQAKDSCSDLQPGESKAYPAVRKASGIMTAPMRIRNLSQAGQSPRFEVAMNFNFATANGVDARAFQGRVRECFNEVNSRGYLKGPAGEVLQINVFDQGVPAQSIEVRPMARGHALSWDPGFSCPTMVHETLHHLGLCDEYRETQALPKTGSEMVPAEPGEQVAYGCRVLGPPDSIMSQHEATFAAVRGTQMAAYCRCPSGGRACTRALNTAVASGTCGGPARLDTSNAMTPEPGFKPFASGNVARILIQKPPSRDSLLMPAHFRAILHPMCIQRNQTYERCSVHAYQTPLKPGDCESVPPECQEGSSWLQ